ncbi:ERF family protein [Devosia soli]|uniref:ERF family protein n=1 Tax=Devosia soli TaxID=361041 RepID=UPI00069C7517|nr:ERF family protein [Devosia soli]
MSALEKHQDNPAPVAIAQTSNPVMDMIRQAVAAGQPLDVIRELKNMATELAAEEAQRAFDKAIAAAKAEIKPVVRTEKGHNGKYADLAAIADAVDPILSRHGLNYRHRTAQANGAITITCILSHELGHREETSITAGADTSGNKNSIQALGSTQTYLMRYTLVAALGLSTTKDDDGNAGGAGELVSIEQIEQLQALLTETNSDVAKFCQVMRVESLAGIPAKRFSDAVAKLNAKKARAAA